MNEQEKPVRTMFTARIPIARAHRLESSKSGTPTSERPASGEVENTIVLREVPSGRLAGSDGPGLDLAQRQFRLGQALVIFGGFFEIPGSHGLE